MTARDSSEVRYSSLPGLLGVLRYEWRMRRAWRSRMAVVRGLWWSLVRRYPCEVCEACGRRVGASTGFTWWHADDEMWMAVNGAYGGTLCIPCFTHDAELQGVCIYWQPVERVNTAPDMPGGIDYDRWAPLVKPVARNAYPDALDLLDYFDVDGQKQGDSDA